MRQVFGRVRHVHDWATIDHLVRVWDRGGDHVGEDGGLYDEEAAIDAEGYGSAGDENEIAVVEPEFVVMLEWFFSVIGRCPGMLGWSFFLSHKNESLGEKMISIVNEVKG